MIVYSWDYDNNISTKWLRMGDCNHCGECCEVMIYLRTTEGGGRDGGDNVDGIGLWHEWYDGKKPIYWQIDKIAYDEPCTCFHNEHGCVKGNICKAWPLHPSQIEQFNNCSYQFIKLNEDNIEQVNHPPIFMQEAKEEYSIEEEYVMKEEIEQCHSVIIASTE